MPILLHTIALEPARWTAQRVAQPLAGLIPRIAATTFRQLEIFEPHLILHADPPQIRDLLAKHGLAPVILSSYLDASKPEAFRAELEPFVERLRFFGFSKVRLFPDSGVEPGDAAKIEEVTARLIECARLIPEIEILLETHDHSLADNPACVVQLVGTIRAAGCANVGLLFQPTIFTAEFSRAQWAAQRALVQHVHLQNRDARGGWARLLEGVVPWREFLRSGEDSATLEFVPSGICSVADFDLERTLAEAVAEAAAISVAV